jgi:hypothetical protein
MRANIGAYAALDRVRRVPGWGVLTGNVPIATEASAETGRRLASWRAMGVTMLSTNGSPVTRRASSGAVAHAAVSYSNGYSASKLRSTASMFWLITAELFFVCSFTTDGLSISILDSTGMSFASAKKHTGMIMLT